MLSQRMWRAVGLAGTLFTGALLLGITKMFNLAVDTNLFSTGITPATVFGVWSLILSWAIYRNRV